jgi:hypoxanthine phosphoribosyltransferase
MGAGVMHNDIHSILITEAQLSDRVSQMGLCISKDFSGKSPVFIGVLKGSFVFMADLLRHVDLPCEINFMAVSSYGKKSETTGAVTISYDLGSDIENRHIILVEDILDSGLTLNYLVKYLKVRKPASVSIAALLYKPSRRRADISADYSGFEIPDAFVVGYGLDYAEKYRNLPYIGILKPEIYSDKS